ncbi:MAG: Rrf2 family transcriptional regulator [Candidatus Goldbacteria bacterium]|nr:Rrf2 family transcriptional regulator [Candidatus Goldiibacteriota bacterium]
MKLSTRTRYGTRLLFELAYNYGKGPILLKDISKRQNISEKYLSKIVMQLKSAGFVKAERGAKGGYILAQSPADINLKDVIQILEGEPLFIDCVNEKIKCEFEKRCPTYNLWYEMVNVVHDFLKSKTLEDLVVDYKRKIGEYGEIYYI